MTYKSSINCLKASLVLVFMAFLQAPKAQGNFPQLTQQAEAQKATLGTDFSVLIASTDTLLYAKEWGAMKLKTAVPVGSASKWLTAAMVMQFVDEGKLSLDDKVAQYLPVFEKYGKGYITLRHCLAHQTGIEDKGNKLSRLLDKKSFTNLDEVVNSYAAREIQTNAGTEFSYNEMGFAIAARVLEVVSKKRFDLLIKQKLFNPLGMRQTTFATVDGSTPNPSTGAKSTPLDYILFLRMLLNNGTHYGNVVLSPAAVAELRTLQGTNLPVRALPKATAGYQYAFGAWVMESANGKAMVIASPGLPGIWPVVDYCRGYAFLIVAKEPKADEKTAVYGDLKKLVDPNFKNGCN